MYICKYVNMYICIYVYMYICICIYINMYMYVCVYIYIFPMMFPPLPPDFPAEAKTHGSPCPPRTPNRSKWPGGRPTVSSNTGNPNTNPRFSWEIHDLNWLVVLTILKNMSSSMGRMTSHILWKNKKMFWAGCWAECFGNFCRIS